MPLIVLFHIIRVREHVASALLCYLWHLIDINMFKDVTTIADLFILNKFAVRHSVLKKAWMLKLSLKST